MSLKDKAKFVDFSSIALIVLAIGVPAAIAARRSSRLAGRDKPLYEWLSS